MPVERVLAKWTEKSDGEHPDDRRVYFSIEGKNSQETYFSADFDHEPRDQVVYGLGMRVETRYRGRGYARRMLGAMAYLAQREGFGRIEIPVESPHVLRALGRLFKEDSLQFYDTDLHDEAETLLPMEFRQAVASLERASDFERDLENREHGIVVDAKITGIKMNQISVPIEQSNS